MGIQHFLPLTALLSVLPASTYGFDGFNVDCGLSVENSYTDENSLSWLPDSKFLANGEEGLSKVATISEPTSNRAMNTLRYFTGEMDKKYCYQVEAPKNAKVLVRVSFKYGNYDNKSNPPKFNLSFDEFHWDTVKTSLNLVETYEVIYKAKADNMRVCVSQTEVDQFPFMSLLQVSHLAPTAYTDVGDDYALYGKKNIALGTMKLVRHPMDKYDRTWYPASTTTLVRVASSAYINTDDTNNKPPLQVMQSARTTLNISYYMTLDLVDHPFYLTMYFSELTRLNSTEKRSFRVYQNGQPSETIIPPYGSVLETNVSNLNDSPNSTISLMADEDSTLPPLINAFELFYMSKLRIGGTGTNTTMLPDGTKSTENSSSTDNSPRNTISNDNLIPSLLGKSTTVENNIPSSLVIIIWAIVVGAFPFPM